MAIMIPSRPVDVAEGSREDEMFDATNIPNKWQGELRFGLLDINALHSRVEFDANENGFIGAKRMIVMTHNNECECTGAVTKNTPMLLLDSPFVEDANEHLKESLRAEWIRFD